MSRRFSVFLYFPAVHKKGAGGAYAPPARKDVLSVPEPETLDEVLITAEVLPFQVLQQFTTFPDHDQKSSPRVEIFLMDFHVLRQLSDAGRENRD